jgi:hypothetical protein
MPCFVGVGNEKESEIAKYVNKVKAEMCKIEKSVRNHTSPYEWDLKYGSFSFHRATKIPARARLNFLL